VSEKLHERSLHRLFANRTYVHCAHATYLYYKYIGTDKYVDT